MNGQPGSGPGIAITGPLQTTFYVVPNQLINGSGVFVRLINTGAVEENVTLSFSQTSGPPNSVTCLFEATEVQLVPGQSRDVLLRFYIGVAAVGVVEGEIRATATGYEGPSGTGGIVAVSATLQVIFRVQQEGFQLTIHLVDPNNQSLPNLVVKLYSGSTMYGSLIADSNGAVIFYLANGTYCIEVFVGDERVLEEDTIELGMNTTIRFQVNILTIKEFYSAKYLYLSNNEVIRFNLSISNLYGIDRRVDLMVEFVGPDHGTIAVLSQTLVVPTAFFQMLAFYPSKNPITGRLEWAREGTYTAIATLIINGTVFSRRMVTIQLSFHPEPVTRRGLPDYTLSVLLGVALSVVLLNMLNNRIRKISLSLRLKSIETRVQQNSHLSTRDPDQETR